MSYTMATSLLLLILSIIVYLPAIYSISSTTDNSNEPRYPSLYQQYCCIDDNRGKNFIITTTEVNKYIICPPETPDSCNNIKSCSDVLARNASAVSGYYNITLANGTIVNQYCDTEPFGCEGEGWTRIGYLNMDYPSQTCPEGFILANVTDDIRYCIKPPSIGASCQSVTLSSSISYTQVCGRVIGYQIGVVHGMMRFYNNRSLDINDVYVDGVTITRGYPRKHIWTFVASVSDEVGRAPSLCPCDTNIQYNHSIPSFMKKDYFCESGNRNSTDHTTVYINDPLWDGQGCGTYDCNCTNAWFNKVLDKSTNDYIELRVCDETAYGDPTLLLQCMTFMSNKQTTRYRNLFAETTNN